MTELPGPVRAALGLVATAIDTVIDTARTLPERAPDLPMRAVTTALQYSLRGQQRYAELIVRGDEVIGRIRGVPEEPPAWATFDDDTTVEDFPATPAPDEQPPAPEPVLSKPRAKTTRPAKSTAPAPTTKPAPAAAKATKAAQPTKAAKAPARKATTARRAASPAGPRPGHHTSAFDRVVDVEDSETTPEL